MNINNKITDAPIKGKSCMPKLTSLLGDVVKLTYLRNRNTGTAAVPLKVQETTIINGLNRLKRYIIKSEPLLHRLPVS